MKQLISKLWSLRREFIRYFVVGVSAFVVDIGSLYLLKEYGNLNAVLAVVINQLVILTGIFFFNKHWSFKAKGVTHRQAARFLALSAANYAFAVAWMWLVHDRLGFQYLAARIVNIVLSVGWNFLLYRYWVFAYDVKRET